MRLSLSAHRPHSRKLGRRVLLPGVALIHACERRSWIPAARYR